MSVGMVACCTFNQEICPLVLDCSYRRRWTGVVTYLVLLAWSLLVAYVAILLAALHNHHAHCDLVPPF